MVETNEQAAALLRTLVQAGNMVLIKGSRGMQMDEIVAALAQPRHPAVNAEDGPSSAPGAGRDQR